MIKSKIQRIDVKDDGYWIWMFNKNIKNYRVVSKTITGKYLFFSSDKQKLIELAKNILIKFKLYEAKVPSSNKPINKDFVLCVYDKNPRFANKLKQYADEINIHYRYWKSDEDTLKGKYSKQFLEVLFRHYSFCIWNIKHQ